MLAPTALAAPPTAHLDPSFGQGGRAVVPAKLGYGARAALMPDDGLVLSTGASLTRLTPSGRVDKAFGRDGTVTPTVPAGTSFEIAGLAVDPQGRILVAGTTGGPPESASPVPLSPGEVVSRQTGRVLRYLPTGALDPSFGEGGVVESDFGLPVPLDNEGGPITRHPRVQVTGVAVDAAGQVIVTGGSGAGVEFGCAHDWFWNTLTDAAFVARLTPSGALDPSFGNAGVFGGRSQSENPLNDEIATSPLVRPGGEVLWSSGYGPCPRGGSERGLAELTADGQVQEGFGTNGAVKEWSSAVALDPDGSITTLNFVSPWYYTKEAQRDQVMRLGPSGALDPSYGRGGRITFLAPGAFGSVVEALAIDPQGRALFGGTMLVAKPKPGHKARRGSKVARQKTPRSLLLLAGREANGAPDPAFGSRGWVATSFGSQRVHDIDVLLDSQGRAVLVGGIAGRKGWAIARYIVS